MATGSGGSKARIVVLIVILAAVAGFGWYKFKGGGFGGGGGGIEATVVNGDLLGKSLDDATTSLGTQPVEQPNPDGERSTAKIYLYTLPGAQPDRQFVRVRVASNGDIIATNFIDQAGNVIVIERAQ